MPIWSNTKCQQFSLTFAVEQIYYRNTNKHIRQRNIVFLPTNFTFRGDQFAIVSICMSEYTKRFPKLCNSFNVPRIVIKPSIYEVKKQFYYKIISIFTGMTHKVLVIVTCHYKQTNLQNTMNLQCSDVFIFRNII